jgi:hypothetical protein
MEIHFGALAAPLSKQLQGCGLSVTILKRFEKDALAITRLHVMGLIPESVACTARKRLLKRIEKAWRGNAKR